VHFGPHDDWEYRNDQSVAEPLRGPLTPVIAFDPDQGIDERLDAESLAGLGPYCLRWRELYP
jgi:hypothetical protein